MTNQIEALFPVRIRGKQIINEYGEIEMIYRVEDYRVEDNSVGKCVSTIAVDDRMFPIFKTYFVAKEGTQVKIIFEKKGCSLKNLEKTTLSNIEKELGANALAFQLN